MCTMYPYPSLGSVRGGEDEGIPVSDQRGRCAGQPDRDAGMLGLLLPPVLLMNCAARSPKTSLFLLLLLHTHPLAHTLTD